MRFLIVCVLFLRSTGLPDAWGDNPGEGGAARLQSPFPFRVFSPSPPRSSFPIPLWHKPHKLHIPTMLHKTLRGEIWRLKSWKPSKNIRSPQEWGGLWKRERERKPVRGERISIVRCALSPLKEVVARTPVNGSCVTHSVKQIEQHTSPQDIGKTVLRVPSTQSIKKRTEENGHQSRTFSPNPGAQPQKAALHSARRLFLMFPVLPSLPGAFGCA